MGKAIETWGLQQADNAIGAALGFATANWQDRRQIRQQRALTNMQYQANKELMEHSYGLQHKMWKDTNYSAQMEELRKAGLNPALLYGMSGGGGTTTGGGSASVGGASASGGSGEILQGAGMGLQAGMMRAQKDLIESQAELNRVEAENKSGVERDNVRADTENKLMQSVINKYLGLDMKDTYNQVKSPNRSIEAKTYQDELEARQGVAGTIYELWVEGKLYDKSINEIEGIALSNKRTEADTDRIKEQIKLLKSQKSGQDISNALSELEKELQTKFGVDRNSPTWMKLIARFFANWYDTIDKID
ncbi:MAG: DNA pilot protein [Malazfec virus 4]